MNLKNIVDDLFIVEDKGNDKQSLKIFYNVDILIHNPNEQGNSNLPPQQITNNQNAENQSPSVIQQQEDFRSKIKGLLNEADEAPQNTEVVPNVEVSATPPPVNENFQRKTSGEISVPFDEVNDIHTLDDLLDFMADKTDRTGKILDQVSIELIFAMAGINQTPLDQIVKQNDKVIIEVDYGKKKDETIGFKVLKRAGVSNVSIVMIKDGEVLDAPFDLKAYNNQLILLRNGVMKK
jgi:hypothetical protein